MEEEQNAAHSDKEKIYIDGDFNDSYEARVKRATGKNTIISKAELKAMHDELTHLRSELQQKDEVIEVLKKEKNELIQLYHRMINPI